MMVLPPPCASTISVVSLQDGPTGPDLNEHGIRKYASAVVNRYGIS